MVFPKERKFAGIRENAEIRKNAEIRGSHRGDRGRDERPALRMVSLASLLPPYLYTPYLTGISLKSKLLAEEALPAGKLKLSVVSAREKFTSECDSLTVKWLDLPRTRG